MHFSQWFQLNKFNARRLSSVLLASAISGAGLVASPITAFASEKTQQQTIAFNIASQPLSSALVEFSQLTERDILAPAVLVEGKQAPALKGAMTADEAMSALLAGSGLIYTQDARGGFRVEEASASGANNETSSREKTPYINEIIVTAEKREQNLQDVPVAISAFTGEMMEIRGIVKPEDLQFSVPGLVVGISEAGIAQVSIRGVGFENPFPGSDPGVPLHIDGHYIQSATYLMHDFLDVERIEVQRGPQGTLYGRNAVGGNINIVTKRPTKEFEGEISVDFGNYNKRQIQGVVSGPLSNKLRGRLVYSGQKHNGYVENTNGKDALDSDYVSIRSSLEYDLSDNARVFISGYYFEDDSINGLRRTASLLDPWTISQNGPFEGNDEAKGISIDVSWDLDSVEFRSLSSYNDAEKSYLRDWDMTAIINQYASATQKFETFSQEFQMLSSDLYNLKWVLGSFYYQENSGVGFDILIENNPFAFRLGHPLTKLDAVSMGVYGQADYSLTENIELVIGVRYSSDEKEMERSLEVIGFTGDTEIPQVITLDDDSWEEITGKVGLNYNISEDLMAYASYSVGYKSGGFNWSAVSDLSYDPETIDAYEIGVKSQWLEDRVQTNLSAFYYDYSDKQEQQSQLLPDGSCCTLLFTNAASATVEGVEIEVVSHVTDQLTIDAAVSYLSAEYNDFETADALNLAAGVQQIAGNTLTNSPEWKWNLGLQYAWNMGSNFGEVTARVDYAWTDKKYFNSFNREPLQLIPSYHHTNARLRWENDSATWTAEIYVRHLEDDDIVVAGSTAANPIVQYLTPRTYGMKLIYRF